MEKNDNNYNILDLFENNKLVKICAPMVRYSKIQFRNLVKLYDCDLSFTPMILADSFCQSEKARQNEFTTNLCDTPLIIQFAANTVHDFVGASYLASPYCNGVDLNCGCPQRWAKELEVGCAMLKSPQVIYDLVRQCRNRVPKPFSVSVKMRLLKDLKETVEICRHLEKCGVSFLSVHARTSKQINGDINKEALKLIKDCCTVPVVANGGLTNLNDCYDLQNETGCDGFMVANGLLNNPSLFAGTAVTSMECVQDWLDICYNSIFTVTSYEKEYLNPTCTISEKPYNLTFQCFHHHLVFMLEKILTRKQKRIFNSLRKFSEVLEFINNNFGLKPHLYEPAKFANFVTLNVDYTNRCSVYNDLRPDDPDEMVEDFTYNSEECNGKYFQGRTKNTTSECDWSDIFLENG